LKPISTVFLRVAVVCLGIAVAVVGWVLLRETPNSGDLAIVLAGIFLAAVPFYIALYHTLKLLKYIDRNEAFSRTSVKALRNIRYCAMVITVIYGMTLPFIVFVADTDDAPGFAVLGMVAVLAAAVIATFAAVLERLLRDALAIKSENELTV